MVLLLIKMHTISLSLSSASFEDLLKSKQSKVGGGVGNLGTKQSNKEKD